MPIQDFLADLSNSITWCPSFLLTFLHFSLNLQFAGTKSGKDDSWEDEIQICTNEIDRSSIGREGVKRREIMYIFNKKSS